MEELVMIGGGPRLYQLIAILALWLVLASHYMLHGGNEVLHGEIHTSIHRAERFEDSDYQTFSWGVASDDVHLASDLMDDLGFRYKEEGGQLVVSISTRSVAFTQEVPPVEKTTYSPYGPYYPHLGYRHYQDDERFGYVTEVVEPGYRVEGESVEVMIAIKRNGRVAWVGSAWVTTDKEGVEEAKKLLMKELLSRL